MNSSCHLVFSGNAYTVMDATDCTGYTILGCSPLFHNIWCGLRK